MLPRAAASAGPDDRPPAGIGGELAEQGVAGAAADDVHGVCPMPGQLPDLSQRPAVGQREAVEDAPDDLRRILPGGRWPIARQAAVIRAGMSPGGRNTGSSGSITARSGGTRAACSSSRASSTGSN